MARMNGSPCESRPKAIGAIGAIREIRGELPAHPSASLFAEPQSVRSFLDVGMIAIPIVRTRIAQVNFNSVYTELEERRGDCPPAAAFSDEAFRAIGPVSLFTTTRSTFAAFLEDAIIGAWWSVSRGLMVLGRSAQCSVLSAQNGLTGRSSLRTEN